jgi:hypothetical protein
MTEWDCRVRKATAGFKESILDYKIPPSRIFPIPTYSNWSTKEQLTFLPRITLPCIVTPVLKRFGIFAICMFLNKMTLVAGHHSSYTVNVLLIILLRVPARVLLENLNNFPYLS